MHLVNVLSFGSKNFNTSLEELKAHFSFAKNLREILIDSFAELLSEYQSVIITPPE